MKWRLSVNAALVTLVVLAGGLAAAPAGSAAVASVAGRPATGAVHVNHQNRTLSGISCLGQSFCLGVGGTFSQTWNGKTWRTTQAPAPDFTYSLDGVACVSASNCLAVGSSPNDAPGQLSEAWNGKAWRILPASSGPAFSALTGVSCPAANDCVAVGEAGFGQATTLLAQAWNGKAWRQLTPVQPAGAVFSTFSGISCAGPANCLAVGQWVTNQGEHALAESWNGTAWTMLPALPNLTNLTAVSCPPVRSVCVAVGTGPNPVSTMASAVWNGSSWTTPTIAKPVSGQPSFPAPSLTGVSCTSATNCITVGLGARVRFGGPFAERWSGGSTWHVLPVPRMDDFIFAGVSCSGPSDCLAVGGGGNSSSLSPYASLAVAWNGTTWRVLRTGEVDDLFGVSCPRVSHCLITGGYLDPVDVTRPLAQAWNGKTVRVVSPPGRTGDLGPVSCPSVTYCLTSDNATAVTWNGKRWTSTRTTTDLILGQVSYVSKNFCAEATGAIWNGKIWRHVSFAQPVGDDVTASIAGLSCVRPTFCLATGWFEQDFETGPIIGMLAEVWDGSFWSLIDPPNNSQAELGPVSCFSPANCMTTGFTFGPPGTLFAARWNGRGWHVDRLPGKYPDPQSFLGSAGGLASISCPTASSCMAVGSYGTGVDVALAWNGRTWRRTKTAGPGGIDSVSCAAASQCVAIGEPDITTLAKVWNGKTWRLIKTINP